MSDAGIDAEAGCRVIEHPTPEAAADAIEAAADSGHVVSIVGPCAVPMADREHPEAARREETPTGDRHVLVKPDGAVVVHGGSETTPIRRFEATDDPVAAEVEGRLHIGRSASGAGPIVFDRIELVASFALDGGSERPEAGVDRHGGLLDRLLAEPDLVEPGFRPLATERETDAGPVDLYGRAADGAAVVVEVKAHRAGPAAVGQLDRYVTALRRDLHADAEVRGVLVAPSATERTRALLAERGFAFRSASLDPRDGRA